ncbi:MAG: YbaK/EbsC family protein [Acidimicrobiales bacterium]|nr:YbaK/EbsC family protein [Acidimicrobiales bacterium]MDG1845099.1 YbaK/EbsC family protein [Acidimicrobiales bacterium]
MDALDRFKKAAQDSQVDVSIQRFPEGTRTAQAAASAVGCDISQIVKSLVFFGNDEPFLVLASGKNRVNEALVAELMNIEKLAMASPDQAREATGFAIGGTPPFGHVKTIQTIMDSELLNYEIVWAAAGTPDTCFPIKPGKLKEVTSALVAPIVQNTL